MVKKHWVFILSFEKITLILKNKNKSKKTLQFDKWYENPGKQNSGKTIIV